MKFYYITSQQESAPLRIMSVLAAPFDGSRTPTEIEKQHLRAQLEGYPDSVAGGIYDLDNAVTCARVFDTRREARAACQELNNSGWWLWRVREVGDKVERKQRKIRCWRVWCGAKDGSGTVMLSVCNTKDGFPTRAAARAVMKQHTTFTDPTSASALRYFVKPEEEVPVGYQIMVKCGPGEGADFPSAWNENMPGSVYDPKYGYFFRNPADAAYADSEGSVNYERYIREVW